ncbi:MAG TPA: DUF6398 domain-containing protein [Streptosporangiaceae bacterium]|nr:DUF6398 domain-containing protein [Streptosporangiaceae bacterium]
MADLGELKIPIATARRGVRRPSSHCRRKAGATMYALGQVNFLFHRSSKPYLTTDELATASGLSKSTLSNKARQIRDLLKMEWNAEFMRQDLVDDENSIAWLIQYDGLVMDVRTLAIPIQVEAFEKGLVPYIPALGREGTAAWLSGNLGFVVPKNPAPGV